MISPESHANYGNCSSCTGEGIKTRYSKINIGASNGGSSEKSGEQSTKCREKDELQKFGKNVQSLLNILVNKNNIL